MFCPLWFDTLVVIATHQCEHTTTNVSNQSGQDIKQFVDIDSSGRFSHIHIQDTFIGKRPRDHVCVYMWLDVCMMGVCVKAP